MCLAVPGRIERITNDEELARAGAVNFGGIVREVNLSFVPEANVGDYVLTHVGFAISRVDEDEAQRVFEHLRELGEIEAELGREPSEGASPEPRTERTRADGADPNA